MLDIQTVMMAVKKFRQEIADTTSLTRTTLDATFVPDVKVTEKVARSLGWAIATDPQWAGGAKTDGTNAQPAIAAALASTAKTVFLPEGEYTITASVNPTAYSGKRLTGGGRNSILKVGAGVATAAILGTSAGVTDLKLDNFKIDMNWTTGTALHAIQITNGARIAIDSVEILNSGGAGILLQGLNAGGGTPDSRVTNCIIDGTGLADGSTGFGIWIKDNSDRCLVSGNRLRNIKGGMGIGLSGAAGTGYPNYCVVTGNRGTMASSTVGFEFIGLTSGCNHNVISHNITDQSYDNGLSISGNYNAVLGNVVMTCWNHGIGVAGTGNTIVGNTIRNCGRQDALEYGGVSIDTGSYNTVANNMIFDDNADASAFRMSFQVKFVNSGGNNIVGPNVGYGWTVGQHTPLNSGRVTTDHVSAVLAGRPVIDLEQRIDGLAGQSRILRYTTAGTSRWTFGVNSTSEAGSNAGSDYEIRSYSDAGADLGPALSVKRSNRVVSAAQGFQHRTKAGIPTDADFATTPADGTVVVDTTNHRLYVRSGGTWKYSALV